MCANILWTTYRALGVSKAFGKIVLLRIPTTYIRNQSNGLYQKFFAAVRATGSVGIYEFPELIESNIDNDTPYFVFESFPNGSVLSQTNVSAKFKSSYDSLMVIRKIAVALKKLWDKKQTTIQLLKPENICYYGDNKLHLLDLGLSQFALDSPDLMNNGLDIWDASYTAPELIESGEANTPVSDIFSLGGVLFYLLTGKAPISSDNGGTPAVGDTISVYNDKVPVSIRALYKKMIHRSSDSRLSDYQELLREIDIILKENSSSAEATSALSSYQDTNTMILKPIKHENPQKNKQTRFDLGGQLGELPKPPTPAGTLSAPPEKEIIVEEKKSSTTEKKKLPLIALIFIIVVAAGAAAYFIL
ncbi:MAG: protein kinase [Lentisphaeraceae bacterium]|nr:protein kinase [Lentisphaeraceae bacterium]